MHGEIVELFGGEVLEGALAHGVDRLMPGLTRYG
jgi:hypothetical protein